MENIMIFIDAIVIVVCICLMIIVSFTRMKDIRKITKVNKKLNQYVEDLKDVRTQKENCIRWQNMVVRL